MEMRNVVLFDPGRPTVQLEANFTGRMWPTGKLCSLRKNLLCDTQGSTKKNSSKGTIKGQSK